MRIARHFSFRHRGIASKRWLLVIALAWLALPPTHAEASIFKGEMLDKVADVLTWVVLFLAPTVGITVFLLIHILPEKIAEKKRHPQAKAIQCLCLLSLVFGGMLWPLAWLWAYTKPVLHKMAYGTDVDDHPHGAAEAHAEGSEVEQLRARIAILEKNAAAASRGEKV